LAFFFFFFFENVAVAQKMSMTEEQPGGAVEEAPPSGPLSERLASKNWKWRASAYDELRDSSPTPVLLEHADRIASMLADKNAAAAEKAIGVAHVFVERAPLGVLSAHAGAIAKELVNSGLGARPSAKAAAQSLLELLVEAEQVDATVDQLLAGCAHKTPKVRLAAIETLLSVVKQFGVAPLPVKTLLKALPPFFNDSDAKVRANAAELAVELHRCLGPIVATQLADLRPAQLSELQPKWAALPPPGSFVPTRLLRSASAAAAAAPQHADGDAASSSSTAAASSSTSTARSTGAVPTIDAYDLAEPVAVLGKLPKSLYSGLASANWKERTAELDNLLPLTDVPRLAPGDYGELCSALRKVIANDANAMCVQKAAAVLANLARGLRADFTAQARATVPVLLGKFKEKKPFVVQALHAALDEIHPRLLQLVDILDDVKVALRDKTPSTRAQALVFVARAVSLADVAQLRKSLKPVASALLNMLNDTLPEVRSAACQAVAALVVAVGDNVAAPILASLDDMKRSNIERAVADSAKKPAPAASAPAAAAPASAATSSRQAAATSTATPAVAAPSRFEKPPATAAARPAAVAAAVASKPSAATAAAASAPAAVDIAPLQTSEQAAELAATLAPADVFAALASKAWKERVDAATKLAELCAGDLDLSQPLAGDSIVRTLQATPGWKESNFQVVQAIFACVTALAQRDKAFSLATASLVMPLLVDKLGDAKLGAPASATLTALAVALGPLAVFELMQPHVDTHRNSKVKASACQWVAEALNAFGSAALPWAPNVVTFAARVMDDPRAKSEAVALLCTVRQHAGSDGAVFARLGDLKPALHTALEAEFAKVASTGVPQPTLVVQRPHGASAAVSSSSSSGASKARPAAAAAAPAAAPRGEVAVVAGAERADISASITAALLEQLGAAKWSDRDEAMSRVSAILSGEGGNCITSNIRELPIALAARLTDSNKNLRVRACALVGQLGAALGPEGEAAAAHLLPPMLTLLGDNRKAMRDAVCAALDSWYDALGLPAMAPYLAAPLATDSSIVRRTLLAWLDQRTAGQELPQCPSLAQAVPALMSAAEDRTADVRQLASSALQLCIAVGVPYDAISHAIDELRPASRVALQPLLDTLAECANVAVPSSRSAAAVARTPARTTAKAVSPAVSAARKPSAPQSRFAPTVGDDNDEDEHEEHRAVVGDDGHDGGDDDDDDDDEVQINMSSVRPAPLASAALTAIASKQAGAFRIETSDDDDDDDNGAIEGDIAVVDEVDVGDAEAPPPTVIDEVDENDLSGLSRTWLETVRAGEPSSVIEALKLWCGVMASDECDGMLSSLDNMTAALVALLPMARNMLDNDSTERAATAGASAPGARFYKYLLNAIKTAFATRAQSQLIASHTLEAVLLELLSGLVHPVLRTHADGELLMVAINQLVISVLEFAALSEALLALLRLLTLTSHSSAHPPRLSETVARALLKLAKAKLSTAEQVAAVDVDRVMLELHRFLDRHPPHAWRADANFELRAVKTLLHTLVSALGDDVRAHLKLVPLDRAQPPVLVGYVHVMLSDRKRRQSAEPSDNADAGKSPTYRENVAPNAAEGAEAATAGNEAYLTRLRSLQQKFGLRSGGDADADAPAPSETPAAAAASTTSIAELRARLARIKATI
jgi:hypothetical protein